MWFFSRKKKINSNSNGLKSSKSWFLLSFLFWWNFFSSFGNFFSFLYFWWIHQSNESSGSVDPFQTIKHLQCENDINFIDEIRRHRKKNFYWIDLIIKRNHLISDIVSFFVHLCCCCVIRVRLFFLCLDFIERLYFCYFALLSQNATEAVILTVQRKKSVSLPFSAFIKWNKHASEIIVRCCGKFCVMKNWVF